MPKNMQKIARNADRKKKRNAALEVQALDDPSVLFGRAMKSLGDGWFQVAVQHPGHRNTLIESRARVGGKSVARIQVNDMVMIVLDQPWLPSQGTDLVGRLEIMGTMSRKNAGELFKAQRIPADLYKNMMGVSLSMTRRKEKRSLMHLTLRSISMISKENLIKRKRWRMILVNIQFYV